MPTARKGLPLRVLWRISWPLARVVAAWFPYSAVQRCPTPAGPYVAAINHLSHLDPPIAGLALRRPVRFLALDELWGNAAILDRIFKLFGAIPFPREGRSPVGALREALRHLEAGGIVGVFPEGRRVSDWGEAPVTRGAAWLAVRAGVPVVPVAVWGTQHAMPLDTLRIRRAPIRVVVGCPIRPSRFTGGSDPLGDLSDAISSFFDREIPALASD